LQREVATERQSAIDAEHDFIYYAALLLNTGAAIKKFYLNSP